MYDINTEHAYVHPVVQLNMDSKQIQAKPIR